jgi:hypothetical protein
LDIGGNELMIENIHKAREPRFVLIHTNPPEASWDRAPHREEMPNWDGIGPQGENGIVRNDSTPGRSESGIDSNEFNAGKTRRTINELNQ